MFSFHISVILSHFNESKGGERERERVNEANRIDRYRTGG